GHERRGDEAAAHLRVGQGGASRRHRGRHPRAHAGTYLARGRVRQRQGLRPGRRHPCAVPVRAPPGLACLLRPRARAGRGDPPQGVRHARGRAHDGAGLPLSISVRGARREDVDRLSGNSAAVESVDLSASKTRGECCEKLLLGLAAGVAAAGAAMAETPVERGSYLVNSVGACGNCHTPRQQGVPDLSKKFSGGFQTFDEPWFTVKGANLTPDRDTGLGGWSDADLHKALLTGMRPNGIQLAPVMPYWAYKVMMPGDIDAIVAYLRSVPAIRNEVQAPNYKTQQVAPVLPGADKAMTADDLKDPVKRGFYLASIAHCMACHARASEAVPPDFKANY